MRAKVGEVSMENCLSGQALSSSLFLLTQLGWQRKVVQPPGLPGGHCL